MCDLEKWQFPYKLGTVFSFLEIYHISAGSNQMPISLFKEGQQSTADFPFKASDKILVSWNMLPTSIIRKEEYKLNTTSFLYRYHGNEIYTNKDLEKFLPLPPSDVKLIHSLTPH